MKKGNPYGIHRVLEPKGVLPQPALKIDNNMEIYDNEILIDVQTLNIDSASFTQIEKQANGDVEEIKNNERHSSRKRKTSKSRYGLRRYVNRNCRGNRACAER